MYPACVAFGQVSCSLRVLTCAVAAWWCVPQTLAADTSAQQQLQYWQAQAGGGASAARGEQFFSARHGGQWSCASCHHAPPVTAGKHANTGKRLPALAPSANADALTDTAKVNKWFKRNCRDVLGRECSAQEKADVLAWLLQVR